MLRGFHNIIDFMETVHVVILQESWSPCLFLVVATVINVTFLVR